MRHMLVLTALRLAVVLFLCGDSVVACCAQDDATLRLSMRFLLRRENPQEMWPVCGGQPCSTRWFLQLRLPLPLIAVAQR